MLTQSVPVERALRQSSRLSAGQVAMFNAVHTVDRRGNEMNDHDAYSAPLLYNLDHSTHSLDRFSQTFPQVWELLNHCIGEVRVIQNIWPAHNTGSTSVQLKCRALWFTMQRYLEQAIALIISRDLNSGSALLRLALEVARDIRYIDSDADKWKVWDTRNNTKQDWSRYTNSFKFDDTTDLGRNAKEIYKQCSTLGVHGHDTNRYFHEKTGDVHELDSSLMRVEVADKGVLALTRVWVTVFFISHSLVYSAFQHLRWEDEIYDRFHRALIRAYDVEKLIAALPSS